MNESGQRTKNFTYCLPGCFLQIQGKEETKGMGSKYRELRHQEVVESQEES